MTNLIKRIDDYMQGAGEELCTVILTDCRAALEAKGEPVCYITQAALDALKRGAKSNVRVWRKPDERLNGDVGLYTKDKP